MIVLLGGTGTRYGPVLGAVAYVLLEEVLSGLTEHWKAILGPILVLVVLFAKGGMAGGIEQVVAAWRRRRPNPSEVVEALLARAQEQVVKVSAATAARWQQAGTAVRGQLDILRPTIERGVGRGVGHIAEARMRWGPWRRSMGRGLDAMGARAEHDLAPSAPAMPKLALALERQLDGLVLLVKGGIAEARMRWQPWKMALGARLVSLVLFAERSIADAAHRWRRR